MTGKWYVCLSRDGIIMAGHDDRFASAKAGGWVAAERAVFIEYFADEGLNYNISRAIAAIKSASESRAIEGSLSGVYAIMAVNIDGGDA